MGRGRKGLGGVEPRANDIRIRFTWNGERCLEPVPWKPTLPNIKRARRLYEAVKRAIDAGTFSYAEHFPDSKRAAEGGAETFAHYGALYLKSKSGLAAATRSQYGLAFKHWCARELRKRKIGPMPIAQVRHSELTALVGEVAWPSARMRNNSLIVLRGTFDMWVADDRRNRTSPMDGVKNAKFQKKPPDPFTPAQADKIIERLYEKYPEQVGAYFECAFYSWMRPEEEIALLWSKIDQDNRTGVIDVVRTFRGGERETKTYTEREIEFTERAWAAIMRMKPHTYLKAHGHVFENPVTGRPWHDERSQRDHYWKPTIKYLGIPYKPPYKTRSTGITMALLRRCDPMWVASMAGHSPKMMFERYAKWIKGVDRGSERDKMNAQLVATA